MELWDLYDENRNLTGKTHVRGDRIPDGMYHLVVHVWIRDSRGRYLISQRSADRPTFPLLWECVGGSVTAGEDSLMGAMRETEEEVGVCLNPQRGRVLFSKVRGRIEGRYFGDIMDVWLFTHDGQAQLENATTDEVAQVRWATPGEIRMLWDQGAFVPTLGYFFETEGLEKPEQRHLLDQITTKTPIQKGWSGDRKYCAETAEGSKYLLRTSPVERMVRKEREFVRMQTVARLGIPMCLPIEFGTCDEGTYSIQSWIDGEDAEEAIMAMDEDAQYRYGLDAGRILAKIHTIPAPENAPDWETRFNAKIDRKIAMYEGCELKYESGGEAFLQYIAENRHLLHGRPQSYQHGDYHIGNMMIDRSGVLTIIDFDRDDFGDPWEEFNRIVWCAQAAPPFASGMVDGYFDGEIPMDFWRLLALYICSNTLSSLPWAIPFGDKEIQVMRQQAAQVLAWYDGMKNVVPGWYSSK